MFLVLQGQVKFISITRSYGFAAADHGGSIVDYYIHGSNFKNIPNLKVGDFITFIPRNGSKGKYAVKVQFFEAQDSVLINQEEKIVRYIHSQKKVRTGRECIACD